ncbi:MAG: T9SS type A sorting domain-containing protein [Bacteroidales bacterium]|nr:T9SS type A sorting domain-containing protein [Bacteroidales bacterium]
MKQTNYFVKICVIATWIILLVPFGSLAQDIIDPADNPNLDQVPLEILEQAKNVIDVAPLSSVITIDNFDNFNLGVDFAEGNIAENPALPSWYFAAYNINGTHHTEDGVVWTINNPNFGVTVRGDPVQVYDSLGNLYYENMYGSSIVGCKVAVSTDNGATWGSINTAISGVDKNWIAADQTAGPYANYVYTTMTSNSGGNFSRSTNQGQSWTNTWTTSTQSLPGMMVCVGAHQNVQGGAVYVVTNGGSTFASTYTFYRSLDGGSNFSFRSSQQFAGYVGSNVNGRHAIQNMRTRPYPFITADNSFGTHRGRLYCVYASNDPPGNGNKPDIWSRYSDDGGSSWSTAIRVNDDANPTQHNQWHPAIWCDKETGRLYIQWMDTRDTPTSDSALIYATYSDDGGATFVENQAISNKKMKINCTTCGGGGTPRYQGDYNGIVSNSKVSMSSWTDFRNGTFMSVTAYFPDFAMALDKIADTLYTPLDTSTFTVNIPEVKLYDDTVLVSASVYPIPTSGNITFSFPGGTEITSFPGSLPVLVTVDGSVPPGNYTATFEGKGPNGTPVHRRNASLKIVEGSGFYVNATADPDTICQGASSQLNVSISGGSPPFTYAWTPTTGLSNPNIANPIASPTTTTKYFVTVTDNNQDNATDSVLVTVKTAPPSPGAITGPSDVCKDSTAMYQIQPMTGATSYSWTVPDNATIVTGQNSPTIEVLWGETSGVVSVIVGNECGNSPPSTIDVTVSMILPAPGAILGPDLGCTGIESMFRITEIPGAESYQWSVPADAQIKAGQGTNEVTVIWGTASGEIAVIAQNGCGNSPPSQRTLTATSLPGPAGDITGNDTVCVNHTGYVYSVAEISDATTYIWTLPEGASISAGQGTNEVTIDFSPLAISGEIDVYGANDCGIGSAMAKPVVVSDCPGVNEYNLLVDVTLYPNPAEETLNLRIQGRETDITLVINDVTGNIKFTEKLTNVPSDYTKKIDVSGFAEGLYFIRMSKENRYFIEKFVVQR